jgi:hypothetical protein
VVRSGSPTRPYGARRDAPFFLFSSSASGAPSAPPAHRPKVTVQTPYRLDGFRSSTHPTTPCFFCRMGRAQRNPSSCGARGSERVRPKFLYEPFRGGVTNHVPPLILRPITSTLTSTACSTRGLSTTVTRYPMNPSIVAPNTICNWVGELSVTFSTAC